VAWWCKYTSYSTWNCSKRRGFPLIPRLPDGLVQPSLLLVARTPHRFWLRGSGDPEQIPLVEGMGQLGSMAALHRRRGSHGATAHPVANLRRIPSTLSTGIPIQAGHRGVVESGVAFQVWGVAFCLDKRHGRKPCHIRVVAFVAFVAFVLPYLSLRVF